MISQAETRGRAHGSGILSAYMTSLRHVELEPRLTVVDREIERVRQFDPTASLARQASAARSARQASAAIPANRASPARPASWAPRGR